MTTRKLVSDDGTTQTFQVSDDNGNVIGTDYQPSPNSPGANEGTVTAHVDTTLAGLQQWVTNNPNGAVLNGAQTLQLVKAVIGLTKLVRRSFTDTAGT